MRQRRTLLQAGLASATLVLLTGCASVAPGTGFTAADADRGIELRGRFSARTERNGREEGVHGNFVWLQHGDSVQLSLVSPLGQTLAIVTALPREATLELPNQPPRHAPEVDALMQQALGFSLPVSGLRDWLQSRPAAGTIIRAERDAAGRLTELEQQGWTVRFLEYREAPAGSNTPRVRRMDLARTLEGQPLSVRLVVDE